MANIFKKIRNIYICIIIVIVLILVLGIVFSVVFLLNKIGILNDDYLSSFTEISGSSTTISANGDFLEAARQCHEYVRTNGFKYGHSGTMPSTSSSVKEIDCSQYVTWALYEYGYTDLTGLACSGGSLVTWSNSNLELVWSGFTHSVLDIENIQDGDICVIGYESEKGGTETEHTQIFVGYSSEGTGIWYNCGSDKSIAKEEGTDKYNDYDYDEQGFLYVYRVPSLT